VAAPGVLPADIFLLPPEELVKNLFFDERLAQARLAQPEDVDVSLKNRHTTARLAWEPRLHDPFLPKWLHRIDVPVKIIWGKQDRILPVGLLETLKKHLPNAEIHVLERCGHLPHVEKAEEFVEIVCR
jgi:pimeloyl-ACP methyl ester carboxylesterase